MNAPGANTKISTLYSSGNMRSEKRAPEPSNSRTMPRRVNPKVNPRPMPRPSQSDANGLFLAANASARPSTIQLTTISGMKSPNES